MGAGDTLSGKHAFMSTHIAVYPGTFDPLTNGHIDIIQRGLCIFDGLIVAITDNLQKSPLFSVPERRALIEQATKDIASRVTVDTFDTLLVEYVKQKNAQVIIRGLRALSDFEYEFQMALMNRDLDRTVETVFMMPNVRYSFVSSRLVKEVFQFGGDISALVPPNVVEALKAKYPR